MTREEREKALESIGFSVDVGNNSVTLNYRYLQYKNRQYRSCIIQHNTKYLGETSILGVVSYPYTDKRAKKFWAKVPDATKKVVARILDA